MNPFIPVSSAKTFATMSCFIALIAVVSCNKKTGEETEAPAPEFQMFSGGVHLQPSLQTIRMKRTGRKSENPEIQVNMDDKQKDIVRLKRILACDGYEMERQDFEFVPELLQISISPDVFPGLKTLPRVSKCKITVELFNKLGSSHQKTVAFQLIQDSDAPMDISELPVQPVIRGGVPFLLEHFLVTNPGRYPLTYRYKPSLAVGAQKIFQFKPVLLAIELREKALRFSSDIMHPHILGVHINGHALRSAGEGYYDFQVQPKQTVDVQTRAKYPVICLGNRSYKAASAAGPIEVTRGFVGVRLLTFNVSSHLQQWQQSDLHDGGEFQAVNEAVRDDYYGTKGETGETMSSAIKVQVTSSLFLLNATGGVGNLGFGQPFSFAPLEEDCLGGLPVDDLHPVF